MVKRIEELRRMNPHLSAAEILDILVRDNPGIRKIRSAEKMLHAVI